MGHGRPREARGHQGEDRPAGPLPVPEVRGLQGARQRLLTGADVYKPVAGPRSSATNGTPPPGARILFPVRLTKTRMLIRGAGGLELWHDYQS